MAFMAKGVPAKAVAALAGVPRNMAVMVDYNLPIRTVDDLKGKKLGVTTVGSLTDWIGKRINAARGGRTDGIITVPIGGVQPARAAIKTGQLDGYIGALEIRLRARGKPGMARDHHGDAVRRGLHHACLLRPRRTDREAPAGGARVPRRLVRHHRLDEGQQGQDRRDHRQRDQPQPLRFSRAYDDQIGIFTSDGVFDPKAVAMLKQSFIEMGLLKEIPDDKVLFTTEFVPVKAGS